MERIIHIQDYNNVEARYLELRSDYNNARNTYAEFKAAGYQENDIEMIAAETTYRKAQMAFMQYMRTQLETIFATQTQSSK